MADTYITKLPSRIGPPSARKDMMSMRATSRRRQHERSPQSDPDTAGRLEINQILANYYIDTRGHHGRRQLSLQESLRAIAEMPLTSATSPPPSPAARPIDTHGHAFGRGVDGRGSDDVETRAPEIESLTYGCMPAASPALADLRLNDSCLGFGTLDREAVETSDAVSSSTASDPVWITTPVAAIVHPIVTDGTTSHSASAPTESAAMATGVPAVVQTTDPLTWRIDADSVAATACIRTDANRPEIVDAFVSLRGGLARVLNANSVFANLDQRYAKKVVSGLDVGITVANRTRILDAFMGSPQIVMANLANLRSDTGRIEMAIPIFPPIESLTDTLPQLQSQATQTRSLLSVANHHLPSSQVDHPPKQRQAEPGGNSLLAGTVGTKLDATVVGALSLISARPGYRGSAAAITRCMTNQILTMSPGPASGNGTTKPARSQLSDQTVILPLRFEDSSTSGQLVANWVSSAAA